MRLLIAHILLVDGLTVVHSNPIINLMPSSLEIPKIGSNEILHLSNSSFITCHR